MKISVVTVCLNSARTLRYTIESFLRQRHAEKEMVVLDGGSKDDTVAIARSYDAAEIRIVSEPDRGIYDAMNKGFRLFSGDAIGFLNSDDTFHDESALTLIASGLEEHDVVFGNLNMIQDHAGKATRRVWRPGPYNRFAFHLGWAPPHPTFYVRRSVAETVGEFVIDYRIAADYDFMIRALALHRFRALYIPQTIVDFQLGGTSTASWRATLNGNLECRRIRQRRLKVSALDPALVLRPLRRVFQQRWAPQSSDH